MQETFDLGPQIDDLFPNIWPNEDDIPGFRGFMETFFNACHDTHLNILRGLEIALKLPESRIKSLCSNAQAEFRLTHYPPVDVSKLKDGKSTRISEHTDFGTITVLFQDSTGGLEVEDENANGRFIPIESKSRTEMIANVGDTLTWWTNKTLRSANHRVTIPTGMKDLQTGEIPARLSIAYFGKANRDASLRCFPEFRPVGQPPIFDEEVTALEYNQRMVERTY